MSKQLFQAKDLSDILFKWALMIGWFKDQNQI